MPINRLMRNLTDIVETAVRDGSVSIEDAAQAMQRIAQAMYGKKYNEKEAYRFVDGTKNYLYADLYTDKWEKISFADNSSNVISLVEETKLITSSHRISTCELIGVWKCVVESFQHSGHELLSMVNFIPFRSEETEKSERPDYQIIEMIEDKYFTDAQGIERQKRYKRYRHRNQFSGYSEDSDEPRMITIESATYRYNKLIRINGKQFKGDTSKHFYMERYSGNIPDLVSSLGYKPPVHKAG